MSGIDDGKASTIQSLWANNARPVHTGQQVAHMDSRELEA